MAAQSEQRKVNSLQGLRALDLTTNNGAICGRILGDLGADVIKVEKPGGDPARYIGPFYHNIPDGEKSLSWFAYNMNKRSITLNIDTNDGQEIMRRLTEKADFVIESHRPGYLDSLGLGYSVLSALNPRIIMASITPFGQSGPYKDFKGSDIVASAMGGLMYVCGDSDRPPVRCSFDQCYLYAGMHAAVGAMIALYSRNRTGKGQYIDVSVQESVTSVLLFVHLYWDLNKVVYKREGSYVQRLGVLLRSVWPCKDGYVAWRVIPGAGGAVGGKGMARLVEAMDMEGLADEVKAVNWPEVSMDDLTKENIDKWEGVFGRYFRAHTKAELFQIAQRFSVPLCPVSTAKDTVQDEQLRARQYWVEVEDTWGGSISCPGAWFKSDKLAYNMGRAPLIGEHNQDIYERELGLSTGELLILKQSGTI